MTGRPTLYNDEMNQKAEAYIQECRTADRITFVEELAFNLNVCRDTLYQWAREYSEFSEGIHQDALEDKRTPKFSLVYEAIKNLELAPNDVAAPCWQVTNSCLQALIEWYKILR